MIIEKNTKYNQYSTKALRDKTNDKFDSIILHTFMRIAHIKKHYGGTKSQYLNAGHLTVLYTIWCWIPLKNRHTHWFTVAELQHAIDKYLKFDMSTLNLNKYLEDLMMGQFFDVSRSGRAWSYRVRKNEGAESKN